MRPRSLHPRPLRWRVRRSTENTRRGAALWVRLWVRGSSGPAPRRGRATSRAQRARPALGGGQRGAFTVGPRPEPPEPLQPPLCPRHRTKALTAARPAPPADAWTPGAPSPAKTREDVRVPAGNQAPPPPTHQRAHNPARASGGKRSAWRPQSLSQLGSASRGGPSWRPRSRNSTTPPRAQRQLRDPVPGAGVLVPIGWSSVRGQPRPPVISQTWKASSRIWGRKLQQWLSAFNLHQIPSKDLLKRDWRAPPAKLPIQ